MREHGDTRARIQAIALELFTEQGYEATSLREIAQRLGVTKAALYYHFRTKEDIVASMMEDRITAMRDLVEWAQGQPNTPALRQDFIRRYAHQMQAAGHHNLMRFVERNQTSLRDNPKSEEMRDLMISILNLLSAPEDPLTVRIRSALSIFALHATWFITRDDSVSDEQRAEAALEVALGLIDGASLTPVSRSDHLPG
jgi:AcrR family transcriptional regulator